MKLIVLISGTLPISITLSVTMMDPIMMFIGLIKIIVYVIQNY